MDISPSPEFREACRVVLGDDSPAAAITAIRAGGSLMDEVRRVHELIVDAKRDGRRAEIGYGNDGNPVLIIEEDGESDS